MHPAKQKNMKHGFVRVAAATPHLSVADCHYNAEQIQQMMVQANAQGVEVVCFPELSLTGYTCQDLFRQTLLLEEAESALWHIVELSRSLPIVTIVGLPVVMDGLALDCAAVVQGGKVAGLVPKSFPQGLYGNDESRWFAPADMLPTDKKVQLCGQEVSVSRNLIFRAGTYSFGIEVGDDLEAVYSPCNHLVLRGADIIFCPGAVCERAGKSDYLREEVASQSGRCVCGYVFAGCGFGESTTNAVYAGRTLIAENGEVLAEGKRFSLDAQMLVSEIDVERLHHDRNANKAFAAAAMKNSAFGKDICVVDIPYSAAEDEHFTLTRPLSAHPFIPEGDLLGERCEEILFIQSQSLAKRILHTHAETVVVGVSGGLDSTLALLVCAHAFDRLERDHKGIVGITMPGFGTTDRTYKNAVRLMKDLGITIREISIADACSAHLKDLGHDGSTHDTTYENAQARERTQILMDAANQMNGFVVGTGDLSELALGWATYNGDHMSMYGVNAGVPKTLIRHLVKWIAENIMDTYTREVLLDIVDTPISPELIPAAADGTIQQKTEDLVGPYELHDFFLYHLLRHGARPQKIFWLAQQAFGEAYSHDTLKKWLRTFCRRFIQQQYKRSCMPDGPKVGSCSLSPRGDWLMPSDAAAELWLKECDEL